MFFTCLETMAKCVKEYVIRNFLSVIYTCGASIFGLAGTVCELQPFGKQCGNVLLLMKICHISSLITLDMDIII